MVGERLLGRKDSFSELSGLVLHVQKRVQSKLPVDEAARDLNQCYIMLGHPFLGCSSLLGGRLAGDRNATLFRAERSWNADDADLAEGRRF